jgi:hypothetical protein
LHRPGISLPRGAPDEQNGLHRHLRTHDRYGRFCVIYIRVAQDSGDLVIMPSSSRNASSVEVSRRFLLPAPMPRRHILTRVVAPLAVR